MALLAKDIGTSMPNLRRVPKFKWAALKAMASMNDKQRFALDEWGGAVSYVLACLVEFESYDQIENSLKPFTLGGDQL